MKTRCMALAVGVGLALIVVGSTGCSQALVGTWKTDPVPKEQMNYLVQATFKADGNFESLRLAVGTGPERTKPRAISADCPELCRYPAQMSRWNLGC